MKELQDIGSISAQVLQSLTATQAWHYNVIPIAYEANVLKIYASDERWDRDQKTELEILLDKSIDAEIVAHSLVLDLLARYYRRQKEDVLKKVSSSFTSDDFLVRILHEAKVIGSSDIHFETYEEMCRVRIRIDGKLTEKYIVEKADYPALINKIKIKARLDIAEKRLPQDGRIQFREGNEKFDIRVSVVPTLFGEKIVLRLLSKDATNIDIQKLGFNDIQLSQYLESIKKPHGIVLISGPTGSGKTTTLYASLKILNSKETNILTIEDPVEYTLEGINQVQLKEDIGLGFSEALKSFLRQDPDIIMLGEIRDSKTAQMAIRAALTGHLVLSTIHTNSAWGTISRLTDMDLPPYLIASTMNASVAQRLVRLLCQHCRIKTTFIDQSWPEKRMRPNTEYHYKASGCETCHFTGYQGRKAIYEVIPIDPEISESIKNNAFHIDELLIRKGVKKISEQAVDLFVSGETSLEEIYNLLLE